MTGNICCTAGCHKLRRSKENRIIAGICGGLGEYLGIDPTIVRLAWAFTVFAGGLGIVAYLIAYFIIPGDSCSSLAEEGKLADKESSLVEEVLLEAPAKIAVPAAAATVAVGAVKAKPARKKAAKKTVKAKTTKAKAAKKAPASSNSKIKAVKKAVKVKAKASASRKRASSA